MPNISFTKIFIGGGLFILAVSCFTVAVFFAEFADSFTALSKLKMKVQYNSYSNIYSTSISIAVLGLISALAAIAGIGFMIFKEDKNILITIFGFVSALFAFSCMVCEGMYLKYTIYYVLSKTNEYREYDHQSAQNYIEKSIKTLYIQAVTNLRANDETTSKNLYSWTEAFEKLGQGSTYTYNTIWSNSTTSNFASLYAYKEDNYIYAKCANCDPVIVASLEFQYNKTYTAINRVCWPDDAKNISKFDCKNLKVKKIEYNNTFYSLRDFPSLTEDIIVGQYVPNKTPGEDSGVDYQVSDFPVAFRLLEPVDVAADPIYAFPDSTHHFRVSGKQIAKANTERAIAAKLNTDVLAPLTKDQFDGDEDVSGVRVTMAPKDWKYLDASSQRYLESVGGDASGVRIIMAPRKPKDWKDLVASCQRYWESVDDDASEEVSNMCKRGSRDDERVDAAFDEDLQNATEYEQVGVDYFALMRMVQGDFAGGNRGEIAPQLRDFLMEAVKRVVRGAPHRWSFFSVLYTVALINIVVQIFGVLVWACGRFYGPVCESSPEVPSNTALINNQA